MYIIMARFGMDDAPLAAFDNLQDATVYVDAIDYDHAATLDAIHRVAESTMSVDIGLELITIDIIRTQGWHPSHVERKRVRHSRLP